MIKVEKEKDGPKGKARILNLTTKKAKQKEQGGKTIKQTWEGDGAAMMQRKIPANLSKIARMATEDKTKLYTNDEGIVVIGTAFLLDPHRICLNLRGGKNENATCRTLYRNKNPHKLFQLDRRLKV